MICRRCARLLSARPLTFPPIRNISSGVTHSNPASPPPATSTSAAQPFSTPFTPSPSKIPGIIPKHRSTASEGILKSSVPGGTPLKGLGYLKGQEAPVAREDNEYPSWLWGLLKTGEQASDAAGSVGDAFAKSKKQRRLAAKAERALKTGSKAANKPPDVPLEEQSIDLPAGLGEEEGMKALRAREELNEAMRKARRKKIKVNNFLRGMR